ncbi:RNA 2',3'-cyclic phosphodiesterase [Aquabacterium sp.]|uniref:RNA 2',3'-cyclic phosphodiesterase n=1 Tax=Aquabacterium sp. TaxID=1872578 RepID=UPI0037844C93
MSVSPDRTDVQALPRCFVALMAPPAAQLQADAGRAAWLWPAGVRPLLGADLHLTLHFIGDVAAARLPALQAALGRVRQPPVPVTLDTPMLWRSGIAVLAGDATPALRALHQALAAALADAGFALETRPWRPHLTLARRAGGAGLPAGPQPLAWCAEAFTLACRAEGTARRYRELARWPLG